MEIPFIDKLAPLKSFFTSKIVKPQAYVGIDVGLSSVKVVQLKKDGDRAILETYGQLKTSGYLKNIDTSNSFTGFLRFLDDDIISLLRDVLKEANVTAKSVVMSIPASSSFITLAELPKMPEKERDAALVFEARRYVPIPQAEVVTNWIIIEGEEDSEKMKVLFVAVPKDIVVKYEHIAKSLNLDLRAIEVESFSSIRALIGTDRMPILLIHFGFQSTTASIVDGGILRVNHTVDRGQDALLNALAAGLNISKERAEDLKNEVGLSDKIEQQEIVEILEPLLEVILREIERIVITYNRENERKIERIVLTGGGVRLKGILDYVAKIFGIEVVVGNSFRRTGYPQFMQPILRDIAPHFSVSVGLALREITPK